MLKNYAPGLFDLVNLFIMQQAHADALAVYLLSPWLLLLIKNKKLNDKANEQIMYFNARLESQFNVRITFCGIFN